MSENTNNHDMDPSDVTLPIKRTTGDTLEDRLTSNAYDNIIPARYLHQDENGNLTEQPEDLFERVAKNIALAEAVHGPHAPEDGVDVRPEQVKPVHHDREGIIKEQFGEDVEEGDDVTTTLTEENVKYFAYDTVVPELDDDEHREHVESVYEDYEEMMSSLGFIPNSPTLMNAGLELQQLSACFVDSPEDDLADIHETAKEAALTFQSGGGMGYAFWRLRPYGDPVAATGGIASGPITFMETFDQMCETIAQGGKRRGAQMGIMRVSHPDVIEFIHSKNKDVSLAHSLRLNDPDDFTHNSFGAALDEARELIDEDGKVPEHLRNAVEGHLSNFNISVGVTDGFMEALFNGEDFVFTNPRTGEPHIASHETKEMYERYDLGEYVEVGEPLSIPAEKLWTRIIEGAHENGEPGIVFLERVNKKHSFDVDKHPNHQILATNPCGEQPLEEYEACNLGHINLSTLASKDSPDWRVWSEENAHEYDTTEEAVEAFMHEALDMEEFDYRIDRGTRFLDNVVTMSDFPIDKIENTVRDMRKVGLGIMGLAQLYIQLGVRYGSEEGDALANRLMTYINHESKSVSHELAEERGEFNDWEESKYANPQEYQEWFEHHTGEDADDWEDGYPVRNHNTTTIAPTGTTSMVGNTSGGCEPIFNVAYYKNVSQDIQGDEMLVEFDDYFLRVLEDNDIDVEAVKQEAEEQMSNNQFTGVEGLETVPDPIGELFVTTDDLTAKQHGRVQCALQDGVDSAISKTVNAPNSATIEDVDEVFRYIYRNGGKGITFYRDGTRSKQVITTRAQNTDFSDMEAAEAAEAMVEQIEDVFGNVEAFMEQDIVREALGETLDDLFQQVDTTPEATESDTTVQTAKKRDRDDVLYGPTQRIDTGYGKLYVTINEDENGNPFELFATIGNSGGFTNAFTESLAKTVSLALRSGVDPEEIANELTGIRSPKVAWDNGDKVQSIPDAIGIAMERYLNSEGSAAEPPTGRTDAPEQDNATNVLLQQGENPECPECNAMSLAMSEGCKTCQSCGWSEC